MLLSAHNDQKHEKRVGIVSPFLFLHVKKTKVKSVGKVNLFGWHDMSNEKPIYVIFIN